MSGMLYLHGPHTERTAHVPLAAATADLLGLDSRQLARLTNAVQCLTSTSPRRWPARFSRM